MSATEKNNQQNEMKTLQIVEKKSFDDVSVKTSTHRIPEKPKVNPIVPKDSLQTSKTDSLRISK